MMKRLLDLAGASLGLALLWPLIVVFLIGIRLSSAGPVLHRARRVVAVKSLASSWKLPC